MSVIFNEANTFKYVPNGYTYIMTHPNEISHHMIQNGIFESDLIQWCEEEFSGDICLDIGAHIGTYSIHLAKNFRAVYAFEPQTQTFNCLAGNVALNGLSHSIRTHRLALTSPRKVGILPLEIVSEDGGGSTLLSYEDRKGHGGNAIRHENVRAITLDSMDIEGDIDFIKMDVEGAELDVLRGSEETLCRNHYPPIFFEAWHENVHKQDRENLLSYLGMLGYECIQKSDEMVLAVHRAHATRERGMKPKPREPVQRNNPVWA